MTTKPKRKGRVLPASLLQKQKFIECIEVVPHGHTITGHGLYARSNATLQRWRWRNVIFRRWLLQFVFFSSTKLYLSPIIITPLAFFTSNQAHYSTNITHTKPKVGDRGGAVGWGTCATSQKVAGSIPDGVIGIFHWHNPSGRTMALGSTQPLTEMSTGNISWG